VGQFRPGESWNRYRRAFPLIKSQRSEDQGVLVSVCDTGVGLPPRLAERIFEPRLDGAAETQTAG
jgi:signal transduction histidine kinase